MASDLEAIDIAKVVKFKNFQCTIKSIRDATDIDFKGLENFDTFKSTTDESSTMLETKESILV